LARALGGLYPLNTQEEQRSDDTMLDLTIFDPWWSGKVDETDVQVKCVPKENKWLEERIGSLPKIDADIPTEYMT